MGCSNVDRIPWPMAISANPVSTPPCATPPLLECLVSIRRAKVGGLSRRTHIGPINSINGLASKRPNPASVGLNNVAFLKTRWRLNVGTDVKQ